MKLTEIKADRKNPVYVNLKDTGNLSGFSFRNNLYWDGENLYAAEHDMFFKNHAWVKENDVSAREILSDQWELREDGVIPLDSMKIRF